MHNVVSDAEARLDFRAVRVKIRALPVAMNSHHLDKEILEILASQMLECGGMIDVNGPNLLFAR
ncbi:hypothetical protein [Puniceibacterium sediminis]|uniref:Uncharacterized protein n=1 Tax=Puniceibacterium sediminis TaxID=1608407 RepID=A0A238ZN44_9RHOB|nr:hypothetical protein [Puniceibacterium sediminis]SNR84582.1 hypothetical protein SAMN06265370_13517 [Puniceibacterium sediminis]